MVTSTNKIINVAEFIFGKILVVSSSTVKVKCFMSECEIYNDLVFDELISKENIQDIVQGISIFKEMDTFYNEKFLLDACAAIYLYNSTEYVECISDELIKSANNTESLLKLISETIVNIYQDQEFKIGSNYTLSNGSNTEYKNYFLYSSTSFNNLEYVFYKYIAPVANNFSSICIKCLLDYLNEKRNIVIALIIIFCILVTIFCSYVGLLFISKLIHLLSVSRCILKIIPTTVINNTQELEMWIESKY